MLFLYFNETDQLGTGQVQAVTCVCPQVPHTMCPVQVALALRAQQSSIICWPKGALPLSAGHPHGAFVPMQEWAYFAATSGSQGDQVAGGPV